MFRFLTVAAAVFAAMMSPYSKPSCKVTCPTCNGGKRVWGEATKKWVRCWKCLGVGTIAE